MGSTRSHCLALLAALVLLVHAVAHGATPPQQKSVLYLVAENPANAHYAAIYRGFRSELDRSLHPPVQVYAENLDLPQFDSPQYRQQLTRWLRQKYRGIKLDALVVAGTPALRYVAGEDLWRGLPAYIISANDAVVRGMTLPPNMTGQSVVLPLRSTVDLIGRLLPRTRQLALVGNPPGRDTYRPNIDAELGMITARFKLLDLREQPLEQVHTALRRLPADAVVYHLTHTLDGNGRRLDPYTAVAEAVKHANRPVFVDYTAFLGSGAVGGAGIDSEALGRRGAVELARLLAGTAPSALPLEAVAFPPSVDWLALQRWHISPALLPSDIHMLNFRPSVWDRYRAQILSTGALVLALTALIVTLLIERRRRERAVAQSRERLAQLAHLNRGASAVVYSGAIAHDLNQPLAAIMLNAEAAELFLATAPPQIDAAREALADIKRDDRRASDIIQRMRAMLKRSGTAAELIDLRAVIADAALFIAPEVRMREATLRTIVPDNPLPVEADSVQLQQVLINLVLNAMDAMSGFEPHERVVEIEAGPAALPGQALVRVTDRGHGFACNVEHVFDSFTTTKEQGTGLGLAITAAIVREHGGSIRARNVAPYGAEVSFTLPLVRARDNRGDRQDG